MNRLRNDGSQRPFGVALAALLLVGHTYSHAADFGVKASGTWDDPNTWTSPNGVGLPGSADRVYIGGQFPVGVSTLTNAMVGLTRNQSASAVFLGYNASGSGTLDLGNSTLTTNTMYIGFTSGTIGSVVRSTQGRLVVSSTLTVDHANNLVLGAADVASQANVLNRSTVTTGSVQNITRGVEVYSGSALNLGAPLGITGTLDVEGGVVNANNKAISAATVTLGSGSTSGLLNDAGRITATAFNVSNSNFGFRTGDQVGTLNLAANATVSTATPTNVTAGVQVLNGSTLNLGAALNVGLGGLNIQNGTVNANGNAISANSVYLGYGTGAGTLSNPGQITFNMFNISNNTYDFKGTDKVTALSLIPNATASTVASGNITYSALVGAGSTLNLGAPLNLGQLNIENGTVNAHGNAITAGTLFLFTGNIPYQAATLNDAGVITATNLSAFGTNFGLRVGDRIGTYQLNSGAIGSTAEAGNVTGNLLVYNGSIVNLGAGLNVSGNVDLETGTLIAHGHGISADTLYLGYGTQSGTLEDAGLILTRNLLASSSRNSLNAAGDLIANQLQLSNASVLYLFQSDGQNTGLTLNGTTAAALSILDTSVLGLQFGTASGQDWIFRWADPSGGNWVATLNDQINQHKITVNSPGAYQIYDQGGYTYIGYAAVPEPSSLVMTFIGILGSLGYCRWHHRPRGQ